MPNSRLVLPCLALILALGAATRLLAQYEATSPFEPGYFEHDWQMFAPADLSEFGDGPDAPIGWFFEYNRTFMAFSGPSSPAANAVGRGVWSWGNRYDVGFMTEENHGWLLEVMNINTPHATLGQFISVELEKTYRLKPFGQGDLMEVFAGPRFTSFHDVTAGVVNSTSNSIIGGQLGARWFIRKGRWVRSAEARAYVGQNFQSFDMGSRKEFVVAGDIRAQAAFILTKDVSLVGGFQVLGFGKGIGRGNNINANDQEMIIAGFSLGFVIDR